MFADMYRAYELLSETMRGRLDSVQAAHDPTASTSYEKEFARQAHPGQRARGAMC